MSDDAEAARQRAEAAQNVGEALLARLATIEALLREVLAELRGARLSES